MLRSAEKGKFCATVILIPELPEGRVLTECLHISDEDDAEFPSVHLERLTERGIPMNRELQPKRFHDNNKFNSYEV